VAKSQSAGEFPAAMGVRKHIILDGPTNSVDKTISESFPVGTTDEEHRHIQSVPGENVSFGKPLCGERGDSFIVNLRFIVVRNRHKSTRRTGYRELYGALWMVQQSTSCSHKTSSAEKPDIMELSTDSGAVVIQGDDDPFLCEERAVIYRTGHSTAARWWALATLAQHFRAQMSKNLDAAELPRVLLRRKSCCLECTINQAILQPSQCFVVL
jgi:hypothetical protein